MGAEVVVISLVLAIVIGIICAAIANSRGRSPIAWFFAGVLVGWNCIGIVIILILVLALPNLKVQEEREERMRRENRRLRERLRKDRTVADQRHDQTLKRLDVHDEAVGIDTSGAHVALPETTAETNKPERPKPVATPIPDDGTEWFYLVGQDRVGPLNVGEMKGLWNERRIGAETLVWCASMADWVALSTVTRLRSVFHG